jgi:ribosomal protein S27E
MIELQTAAGETGGWTPLAEARTVRAVCDECGAHAAVVTSGASMTGTCSVCGGGSLHVLGENVPPPRRWEH